MRWLTAILGLVVFVGALPVWGAGRGIGLLEFHDPRGEPVGLYRESHALVIGASDYSAGWPRLPGVEADVAAVGVALERQGFDVTTVTDPDGDALRRAFEGFIQRHGRGADNRLLFYFAGHGHTLRRAWGGEMGYIVPVDAPNPDRDPDGFLARALDMKQVEVYAQQIDAKHALFVFDSCFSGSLFALSRAVPEHIGYKTARPVRQFITSGQADEEVPDVSLFRDQFVAALDGEGDLNGDGYVTGAELGEYLQERVINYSHGAQHPQYGKIRHPRLDKGDFVLLAGGAAAAEGAVPTPGESSLTVVVRPEDARVRVMNIVPRYRPGIRLAPGRYRIRVDKPGYLPFDQWIALTGPQQRVEVVLTPAAKADSSAGGPDSTPAWTEPLTGMTFVPVEGGCFQMGSPAAEVGRDEDEALHRVCVQSFAMADREVTNRQYRLFRSDHDSGSFFGLPLNGDEQPAVSLSWHEATAFARWLSERTGGRFRLPTAAQWEYAARAGTVGARYWGEDPARACRYANVADRTAARYWPGSAIHDCDDGYAVNAPVGAFEPNPWGLYDMLGNVWEWTCSVYVEAYAGAEQRCADSETPAARVMRGGARDEPPRKVRSASRYGNPPDDRSDYLGFRLAREP
jgi:formylglycine-generating enzyme required for sulfatase activity